jgi:hypothetical protein
VASGRGHEIFAFAKCIIFGPLLLMNIIGEGCTRSTQQQQQQQLGTWGTISAFDSRQRKTNRACVEEREVRKKVQHKSRRK